MDSSTNTRNTEKESVQRKDRYKGQRRNHFGSIPLPKDLVYCGHPQESVQQWRENLEAYLDKADPLLSETNRLGYLKRAMKDLPRQFITYMINRLKHQDRVLTIDQMVELLTKEFEKAVGPETKKDSSKTDRREERKHQDRGARAGSGSETRGAFGLSADPAETTPRTLQKKVRAEGADVPKQAEEHREGEENVPQWSGSASKALSVRTEMQTAPETKDATIDSEGSQPWTLPEDQDTKTPSAGEEPKTVPRSLREFVWNQNKPLEKQIRIFEKLAEKEGIQLTSEALFSLRTYFPAWMIICFEKYLELKGGGSEAETETAMHESGAFSMGNLYIAARARDRNHSEQSKLLQAESRSSEEKKNPGKEGGDVLTVDSAETTQDQGKEPICSSYEKAKHSTSKCRQGSKKGLKRKNGFRKETGMGDTVLPSQSPQKGESESGSCMSPSESLRCSAETESERESEEWLQPSTDVCVEINGHLFWGLVDLETEESLIREVDLPPGTEVSQCEGENGRDISKVSVMCEENLPWLETLGFVKGLVYPMLKPYEMHFVVARNIKSPRPLLGARVFRQIKRI